jgi:hypothetical protein
MKTPLTFKEEKGGNGLAQVRTTIFLAMLLLGCDPTYPNGVIKDRDGAISAWRHQCSHGMADRNDGSLVVTLSDGKWTVGFRDAPVIATGIFDAKSGKMERCYFGARN